MSQNNYCRFCGFLINGTKFCTSCGKEQPTSAETMNILQNANQKTFSNDSSQLVTSSTSKVYCHNCGTLMNDNTFCPSCGEKRMETEISNSGLKNIKPKDSFKSEASSSTPITTTYDETQPTKEFLIISYTLTVLFPVFGIIIYLYVRVTNPEKSKKIINVTLYFALFYILGLLAYGFFTFIIVLVLFYPLLIYSIYHPEKFYFGFNAR